MSVNSLTLVNASLHWNRETCMYDRARDATSRRVPSLASPCYLLSFPIECARGHKKMRESCADTGRLIESSVWTSISIPFRYTSQGPAVIHPSTDPHWCLDASETYHTPNAVGYKQYISIQETKTSVKIQHEPVVESSYDDVNFNVSLSYWGIYAFVKQNRDITVKVLRIVWKVYKCVYYLASGCIYVCIRVVL